MFAQPSQKSHLLNLLVIVLLAAGLIVLAPLVAYAATFTVTTTADTVDATPGDGICADSSGACSLRAAISEANALDGANSITLPAGTYTLTIAGTGENSNATGDLDVTSRITINGDGASDTIIQAGAAAGAGIDRVLHVVGSSDTLTLNDVILRYGKASGNSPNNTGGGIRAEGGTVTLNRSAISDNSAGYGGGIYILSAAVDIHNSTLSGNSASTLGGGIMIDDGTLTLDHSTLSGNSGYFGGGIFGSSSAEVTISHSTLSGNSADQDGGGLHNGSATTIDHSLLYNNSAYRNGGATYHEQDTITLSDTTLSHNSAASGGGVYQTGSSSIVNLAHCTVTDNTAGTSGGGFFQSAGATNLKNSIVAGNHQTGGTASADCSGTITSQGYNVVGDGTGCPNSGTGDQTTGDPLLAALADNGGPTQTHALQSGSPALNTIPAATNGCGSDYTDDQRLVGRPIGGSCDVGAYEGIQGALIWDNGGGDGNWSTAANWSENTVPTAANLVVFSNMSDDEAVVNAAFTVAGVLIDGTYDGAISQGGSDLAVTGAWSQSGGTFTGGSAALDLGGAFDLSSGVFTAPAGLMTVSGGFHHTGGTFDPNDGRVILDNTTDQTLATSFNDLVLNDGLLGYWKLDEGAGTIAADACGYNHDGTLVSGPVWSMDVPATMDFHDPAALSFDGNNDYVNITDTTDIDSLQQLTLAAWVKLNSLPAGNMRFITLRNEKAVLRYDDQALDFYLTIDGGIHHFTVSGALGASGAWRHVAGVYDGSTMRLFLDGAEQAGMVSVSGIVGTGAGIHLSSEGETLDGLLDDVRIYNRALTAAEIADLAAGEHPQTSVATTTLAAALDVNGDLTLDSGTLDVSTSNCASAACAINLAGDFTRNGGVFTAGTGVVTIDGAGTQILDTDAITFYNVTVNSGATLLTRRNFTASTLTNNGALQQTKNVVSGGVAFLWFGGYGGLSISGANLGDTTVTIRGNQDCTATADEPVRRCFDIAPATPGGSARVQFYFAGSELAGNACNTLNAYRWDGSAWQQLALDPTWGGDGRDCEAEPYSVRAYPVAAFGPFVLKSPAQPVAVTGLAASDASGSLQLDWTAVTEDLDGYRLAGVTYSIYRGVDAPFFEAGAAYASGVTDTWYVDTEDVIGDPAHSYYYLVRAVANGLTSADSYRVGTCAFGLTPGSAQ